MEAFGDTVNVSPDDGGPLKVEPSRGPTIPVTTCEPMFTCLYRADARGGTSSDRSREF